MSIAVRAKKQAYADKLRVLIAKYKNILICGVDFVGSNQLQQIRIALRDRAVVLMGKNTIIRKVIRDLAEENPKAGKLLPLIAGNVGLVFTNEPLKDIRVVIQANKVPAAAKTGLMAPNTVIVPAGPTGLDPGQTGFFQSLEIATKIMRGSIEILNDVVLVAEGDRVTASHVTLLAKLNIKPFTYGMVVTSVYEDGFVYAAKILDMSDADLLSLWYQGVRRVAALGNEIGVPTIAAVPNAIRKAFRKLAGLSLATDFKFAMVDKLMSSAATAPAAAEGAPAAKVEEEPEEEEEEEEDFGGVGGLFGDGGDEDEEGDEEWDEEEGDEEGEEEE